jgi:hypothetical protein
MAKQWNSFFAILKTVKAGVCELSIDSVTEKIHDEIRYRLDRMTIGKLYARNTSGAMARTHPALSAGHHHLTPTARQASRRRPSGPVPQYAPGGRRQQRQLPRRCSSARKNWRRYDTAGMVTPAGECHPRSVGVDDAVACDAWWPSGEAPWVDLTLLAAPRRPREWIKEQTPTSYEPTACVSPTIYLIPPNPKNSLPRSWRIKVSAQTNSH